MALTQDTSELAELNHAPLATGRATDILQVIREAMSGGRSTDELKEMFTIYKAMVAFDAKGAFAKAMTAFRRDCPPIPRRHENAQFKVTRAGVTRPSRYAALEDIAEVIDPIVARHGLSYRWGDITYTADMISQACIVAHEGGHSESTVAHMPRESRAGASEAQKMLAITRYVRRVSLIAAFGLTDCDDDLDGADTGGDAESVTEQQVMQLEDMIQAVDADRNRFLRYLGVKALSDLPASRFEEAMTALERKRQVTQ